MRIRKDKSIGRVLFIVEGGKKEFSVLRRIFFNVLDYEYVQKARQNDHFKIYRSKVRKASKVVVINTEESNISDICDENRYLDHIYERLINEHGFPIENTRIYYIFDRDPESNKDVELIKKLIRQFQNAYENQDNMNGGLLLLSYPCIESYDIACFMNESYMLEFGLGKHVKAYVAKQNSLIQHNKYSVDTLIKATNEMMKYLMSENIPFDIDRLGQINMEILCAQEKLFEHSSVYKLVSLLSVALIDLGIIEPDA